MKQGIFSSRLVRTASALAALALGFSSCIKDNLDDCPPLYNVRLIVTTDYEKAALTRGPAEKEWYHRQIDNVTVYVFDQSDKFVASWTGPEYTLGKEYVVPFCLEEGKSYRFVAWTNLGETYVPSHAQDELHGGISHGDLYVETALPEDRTLTEDIPHRHQGELDLVPVFSGGDNVYEIVLSPHTYKINFIVDDPRQNDNRYQVAATDSNVRHGFDLAHAAGHDHYHHIRTLSAAGATRAAGESSASMIMTQIGDDTDTSFELTNTVQNTSLHSGDLLEAIEYAYGELIDANDPEKFDDLHDMLDNKYEYDIILEYSLGKFEIVVNPWNYKGNSGQL